MGTSLCKAAQMRGTAKTSRARLLGFGTIRLRRTDEIHAYRLTAVMHSVISRQQRTLYFGGAAYLAGPRQPRFAESIASFTAGASVQQQRDGRGRTEQRGAVQRSFAFRSGVAYLRTRRHTRHR